MHIRVSYSSRFGLVIDFERQIFSVTDNKTTRNRMVLRGVRKAYFRATIICSSSDNSVIPMRRHSGRTTIARPAAVTNVFTFVRNRDTTARVASTCSGIGLDPSFAASLLSAASAAANRRIIWLFKSNIAWVLMQCSPGLKNHASKDLA